MLPQNKYICTNFVLDLYCIVLYCHVLTNSDEIRKDLKFLVESEFHSDLNDSQFFYYQYLTEINVNTSLAIVSRYRN